MAQNWAETHSLPTTGAQYFWLNNRISHWWKVSSFLWTTLMQTAPGITGAGYEYDLTWLYTLETSYSIFAQRDDTTQVCTRRVIDVNPWVQTSRLAELNVKTGPHLDYISAFSILLLFSRLLCFLKVSGLFHVIWFWYSINIRMWVHFHFSLSECWSVSILQLRFSP